IPRDSIKYPRSWRAGSVVCRFSRRRLSMVLETRYLIRSVGDFFAVDHLNLLVVSCTVFGLIYYNVSSTSNVIKMFKMLLSIMEEADTLCQDVAILHRGKVAITGSPAALKASLETGDATMDDVFVRYAGTALDSGGTYKDVSRSRRNARRVG